ncbi:hypothetical protein DPMN_059570 [Dreissena polymorpha]|uniref:Uncharacterized protein n=1 Tax=Dreissena polymorpha TaxID=45954 RepID=A0A9D4HGQ9_DREPO|nr:hypothetical protein DPMN_059570 [Dreissena polymorpha]
MNVRVFTNQMWTDGRTRTKTNPKTSPEQSAKTMTSRSYKENCPPPPGGHFHDDRANNVTSRVKMRPPGSHVFQRTETNVLTKFHGNLAKNVTSRKKTAPPTGGHVFSLIWTIFELVRDIDKTNVLTKFHDDWANNETNVLNTFHEDCTKNVTSRVLTCFHYIHIAKTAPPLGDHAFSSIWTIFKLVRDIDKTNVLTKFYDVFTRKTAPPTGGNVFQRTGTTF